jgi:uncharacterized protein YciI
MMAPREGADPDEFSDQEFHVLVVRHLVDYEEVRVHSPGHVDYLNRYQAAGIFLASGQADVHGNGGAILARGIARTEIESIIKEDPYLREGVSSYQIITIRPRTDPAASASPGGATAPPHPLSLPQKRSIA